MSSTVIKVENLYKEYKLGVISHGTLTHDLQSMWARLRGKEDPNSLISHHHSQDAEKDSFLALKDVSFEVKAGERVGIIGKNGAGKSTLLKIISRITSPTKGEIKIKGRIGSLLEVGTGFHPELTGRENIYLNGAILGMSRREIDRKLDEIIDFAGIEKHIDTPVKRYSSGMNVRLGFAVAAHLEPEILVVDEVLAVGDAEFQKKALGKMESVSKGEGRTILFVSHNMTAVQQLCNSAILLNAGKVTQYANTKEVISSYLTSGVYSRQGRKWENINSAPGDDKIRLFYADVIFEDKSALNVPIDRDFYIIFDFINYKNNINNISYSIHVLDRSDVMVFGTNSIASANSIKNPGNYLNKPLPKGKYRIKIKIPGNLLNDQTYKINIAIISNTTNIHVFEKDVLNFSVIDTGKMREDNIGYWGGTVRPKFETQLFAL